VETKAKEKECELLECGADDPDQAWEYFARWSSKYNTSKNTPETKEGRARRLRRLDFINATLPQIEQTKNKRISKHQKREELRKFWQDYEYWQENTREINEQEEAEYHQQLIDEGKIDE